jgi:thiamine biosynthesis lipoprotein
MKKLYLIISLLLTICTLFACAKENHELLVLNFDNHLNTSINITLEYNSKTTNEKKVKNGINSKIENVLTNVENEFKYVNEINNNAGLLNEDNTFKYTKVSNEFMRLLKLCIDMGSSDEFKYYDITSAVLTTLWNKFVPTKEQIEQTLPLVNAKNVIIDSQNNQVYLKEQGMQIDLSSVINGYTTELIKSTLKENGYSFFIINVGSNVYAEGTSKYYQAKKEKTYTELTNPFDANKKYIKIKAENYFITTVSKYQSYQEIDGIKYSSIINPETGYPTDNLIESITVLGNKGDVTDAMAYACFNMPLKTAMDFLSEQGFKGIIISKTKQIYMVGNFEYELIDSEFKITERK